MLYLFRRKAKNPDSSPAHASGRGITGTAKQNYEKFQIRQSFFRKSIFRGKDGTIFRVSHNNESKAIRMYEQNILLSESLEPCLSVFEVALRNAIIIQLERMARSKRWYICFRSNAVLRRLNDYVDVAITHIQNRGEQVTEDKINGELTLGFWVSLFNAEYERILWKYLRLVFPNMPKGIRKRKNVSSPLNAIRILRNRVYHNESIGWDLNRLSELHNSINEVMRWMNIALPEWLKRIDRFKMVEYSVRLERKRPF